GRGWVCLSSRLRAKKRRTQPILSRVRFRDGPRACTGNEREPMKTTYVRFAFSLLVTIAACDDRLELGAGRDDGHGVEGGEGGASAASSSSGAGGGGSSAVAMQWEGGSPTPTPFAIKSAWRASDHDLWVVGDP